jgi:hypothetical protein
VHNFKSVSPHLRRCSTLCQPFTPVHRVVKRHSRLSWGGHLHQESYHRSNIKATAFSDTGPVDIEQLLEVAEHAAKAGAAVCPLFHSYALVLIYVVVKDGISIFDHALCT